MFPAKSQDCTASSAVLKDSKGKSLSSKACMGDRQWKEGNGISFTTATDARGCLCRVT